MGDFADTVSRGPSTIDFGLYDEPAQWREIFAAVQEDLQYLGGKVVRLNPGPSTGSDLVGTWIETMRSAGQRDLHLEVLNNAIAHPTLKWRFPVGEIDPIRLVEYFAHHATAPPEPPSRG